MPALVEFRTFAAGVGVPGAPVFLHFVDRAGVPLLPQPAFVYRGSGKQAFEISDEHVEAGAAYLIDGGAGLDARYFAGSKSSPDDPLAAFCFTDPGTGALYAGGGAPAVSAPDYVTIDGTVRAPNALVAVAAPYFYLLEPTSGDLEAGGVMYVVTAPGTAIPESYDGTFATAALDSAFEQLRLLIGDTNPADELLTDAQLAFFLTQSGGELYPAAIAACYAIAAKFSRQADFTNLSLSLSASQRAEAYRQLAKDLAAQLASGAVGGGGASMYVGGLTKSGKEALDSDTDAVQPSFSIGQDDEPGTYTSTGPYPRW